MNRLQYWLHARTRYSLHSPFLFECYDKVLMARPEGVQTMALPHSDRRSRRYHEVVFTLADYYSMQPVSSDDDITTLTAPIPPVESAVVMRRPHRSRKAEQQWETLCADKRYNIAIDLYDVGVVLYNPHLLLPQRWLLR